VRVARPVRRAGTGNGPGGNPDTAPVPDPTGGRPVRWGPAQVEGVAVGAGEQPPDQQVLPRDGGGGQGPVAVAGPFGSVPAGSAFEHRAGDGLVGPDRRAGGQPDLVVAGDDPHIGQAVLGGFGAQWFAASVDLVERDPPGRGSGRQLPVQLVHGQLRLGRELQVLGDPGGPTTGGIGRPALRHVHVEVDPGLPVRGDVGAEHGGHAVLHAAGAPGVLGCHARGGLALLQLRGLVDRDPRPDQIPGWVGDRGGGQPGQLIAQQHPVPPVGPEQVLHPALPVVAGRFGQRPAVGLHPRPQHRHVVQRHRGAAPLRHHRLQDRLDPGVRPGRALGEVFYAGHRGRVVVAVIHNHETRHGRTRMTSV